MPTPKASNVAPNNTGENGGSGAAVGGLGSAGSCVKWQETGTTAFVTAPASISKSAEPLQIMGSLLTLLPLSVMVYPAPTGIPSTSAEMRLLFETGMLPDFEKLGPVTA